MKRLLVALLMILALVLLFFVWQHTPAQAPVTPTVEAPEESLPARSTSESYTLLSEQDWPEITRALDTINRTQGKTGRGEFLEFGIVEDPDQQGVFYFATSEHLSETESFHAIYRYEAGSQQWERLYKLSVQIDAPSDPQPVLHVLGYYRGSLIVRRVEASFSPGPCYDTLTAQEETSTTIQGTSFEVVSPLLLLDLENPYSPWETLTLPEQVRQVREAQTQVCLNELF